MTENRQKASHDVFADRNTSDAVHDEFLK